MGASGDMFIDLRMSEQDFGDMPPGLRSKIEIRKIDEVNPEYKDDELWLKLKAESSKAYRALKKREFELRQE